MYSRYSLRRGGLIAVIAIFTALVCLFVGVVYWGGRELVKVNVDFTYYFLIRDCEDSTAAAIVGQVYGSGGAGYLLREPSGDCVVIACYYTQGDAERVQTILQGKNVDAHVRKRSIGDFVLGRGSKEEAERIASGAQAADTCARLLYDTANGLERVETSQDEARAAVRGVAQSLRGLSSANGGKLYAQWNADMYSLAREAEEIANGILFAKDLRRIQVGICLAVLSLKDYFS